MKKIDMQELLPELLSELALGKEVILTGTGRSMYPTIDEKQDQLVLTSLQKEALRVGHVYLYQRSSGVCVFHRLCKIAKDGSLTFMGDRQSRPEPGIRPEQVLAHVPRIIRNNQLEISFTDGPLYRKAVRFMRFRLLFPGHQQRMAVLSEYVRAVKRKFRNIFR